MDALKNLIKTFASFLEALQRYYPTREVERYITEFSSLNFENLNIAKLMQRYLAVISEIDISAKEYSDSFFVDDLFIFPSINISTIWPHITQKQKEKVWTYLKVLYLQSDLILNNNNSLDTMNLDVNTESTQNQSQTENIADKNVTTFDPLVGVKGTGENFTINNMFSGMKKMSEEPVIKPDINMMINTFGIDKMLGIDMEKLADGSTTISVDQIETAIDGLKNILGTNMLDNKSGNMLNLMLDNVKNEIITDKDADGKVVIKTESMQKIADAVATKMQPDVNSNQLDVGHLLNAMGGADLSTVKDENGKPLFNNFNPFATLARYFNQGQKTGMTPEEMQQMKQMQDMMAQMQASGIDIKNLDLKKLGLNNLNFGQQPQKPNNSLKGKKKNNKGKKKK